MTEPLSPTAAQDAQRAAVPDVVIEVVNELLTKRAAQESIIIKQAEVVNALTVRGIARHEIFESRMLDFEARFKQVGWRVLYDKPAYDESYEAYWRFTAR